MPSCKLSARRHLGGRLLCFCGDQSVAILSPKDVKCCHFTSGMLEKWIMEYKPIHKRTSNTTRDYHSGTLDPSTPIGLANNYKLLIDSYGFRTAAYTLEEVKINKCGK